MLNLSRSRNRPNALATNVGSTNAPLENGSSKVNRGDQPATWRQYEPTPVLFFFHTVNGVQYMAKEVYKVPQVEDRYISLGTSIDLDNSLYLFEGRYSDIMNNESIQDRIPVSQCTHSERETKAFLDDLMKQSQHASDAISEPANRMVIRIVGTLMRCDLPLDFETVHVEKYFDLYSYQNKRWIVPKRIRR